MTRPCDNCPYRMDAPRRHWDRAEFVGVLEAERSQFGTVYACHKQRDLAPSERGFCAGWALDQRKRGVPSVALRILLIRSAEASAAFNAITDGGARMFRTVTAMCRANGVRAKAIK